MQGENPRTRSHVGARAALALLAVVLGALALGAALASAAASGGRTRSRISHASATCWGAGLMPTRTNAATVEAATLCLIDQARVRHGLPALTANSRLQAVAMSQVKNMVRLDYFADVRPSGTTPLALILASRYGANAASVSAAENIGWGTQVEATPAQMVAGWLQSPPHREAILTGEFREAGVGATAAAPSTLAQGQYGATYALELARP